LKKIPLGTSQWSSEFVPQLNNSPIPWKKKKYKYRAIPPGLPWVFQGSTHWEANDKVHRKVTLFQLGLMRLIRPLIIHANMLRNYRLRLPTGRRQTSWLCASTE